MLGLKASLIWFKAGQGGDAMLSVSQGQHSPTGHILERVQASGLRFGGLPY